MNKKLVSGAKKKQEELQEYVNSLNSKDAEFMLSEFDLKGQVAGDMIFRVLQNTSIHAIEGEENYKELLASYNNNSVGSVSLKAAKVLLNILRNCSANTLALSLEDFYNFQINLKELVNGWNTTVKAYQENKDAMVEEFKKNQK